MVEVSTCFIEPECIVDEGAGPVRVSRGVEIGHFEAGGSTHLMLCRRGRVTLEDWAVSAAKHRKDPHPTPLGSIIATAVSA
jgi:phosphatidylserine decarboxylase